MSFGSCGIMPLTHKRQMEVLMVSESLNTLCRVNELRVDALYGKKKHYNAADRKGIHSLSLGIPVVIINVLLSSLLFWIISDSVPIVAKWVGAVLGLLAAGCGAVQTFLNVQKQIEGHRRVASRYLAVSKACSRLTAYYKDGSCNEDELIGRFEGLAREYDEINKDAESFPTSHKDYEKARRGMNESEEVYFEAELKHRGE